MQEFQKRVVDEKSELDLRLGKLKSFLEGDMFNSLPHDEQTRMKIQSSVMDAYSAVLNARIQAFA